MYKLNQKGSADSEGIIVLVIIGVVILGIMWLFGFNFGMENEGEVKYSDCREVIEIKEDSLQRYFHSFTCATRKTRKGAAMGGVCVSVKTAGSLFSGSNECEKAYVYEKDPSGGVCTKSPNIYLGYDDMCHTDPQ